MRPTLLLVPILLSGCDFAYPEVVVVNDTSAHVQIRNVSFNGCVWDTVIVYGDATSPGRCLVGEDRVHFKKFDAAAYMNDLPHAIDGASACGTGSEPNVGCAIPSWFNYQTRSAFRVGYGEFRLIGITLSDIEQDFSVPGPYGH